MRKILEKCPTCGGEIEVTRLSCKSCETVILGRYEPCMFCKLSPDSLRFLEVFVRNRGNLKEMERELGQSYWSLRSRLDEVIHEMGYETATPEEDEDVAAQRRAILERLDRGQINAAQAADQLAALKVPRAR